MTTDKSNMLCILKILEEYSDEDHILSIKELLEKMKLLYGRNTDRRTVYSAVEALQDFGYEISTFKENGKGYYLVDRTFSPSEIRLLIDAIYSCEYISKKQTEELLEKLRSFLSVHDRKKYSYTNIISPDKKSPNAEVFLNIEILDAAITEKRKVSFTYMDYDYNKKLKPRRDEKYIASPYAMICEDAHYYLVLISQGHDSPSFYRIDMMKDIRILEEPLDYSKKDAKLDSLRRVVYAHSGEPEQIHLHCDKQVLRYVIEDFGGDVLIEPREDGSFDAMFKAAPQGLIYWALQYMQNVEVIAPAHIREQVIETIRNNKYTE
ncbi:MAG: WYL domain-containing transcriptional regulator [Firmicutes bacterium]|nr:WYL domain-containing transcriptional regulator [Bacillota bacterium]